MIANPVDNGIRVILKDKDCRDSQVLEPTNGIIHRRTSEVDDALADAGTSVSGFGKKAKAV